MRRARTTTRVCHRELKNISQSESVSRRVGASRTCLVQTQTSRERPLALRPAPLSHTVCQSHVTQWRASRNHTQPHRTGIHGATVPASRRPSGGWARLAPLSSIERMQLMAPSSGGGAHAGRLERTCARAAVCVVCGGARHGSRGSTRQARSAARRPPLDLVEAREAEELLRREEGAVASRARQLVIRPVVIRLAWWAVLWCGSSSAVESSSAAGAPTACAAAARSASRIGAAGRRRKAAKRGLRKAANSTTVTLYYPPPPTS